MIAGGGSGAPNLGASGSNNNNHPMPLLHTNNNGPEFVSMMSVSSEGGDGDYSPGGFGGAGNAGGGGGGPHHSGRGQRLSINSSNGLPALLPATSSSGQLSATGGGRGSPQAGSGAPLPPPPFPSTAAGGTAPRGIGLTLSTSSGGGGGVGGGSDKGPSPQQGMKPFPLRSSTTQLRRHGETGKMTSIGLNTSIASPMMTSTMSSPLDSLAGPILSSSSVSHLPAVPEVPIVKSLAAAIDRHSTGRPVGSIFSLFGSLERRVKLSEMVALFMQHRETIRSFLSEVFRLGEVFSPPFDLIAALEDPSMRPSDSFFETPLISWPFVTLYLVASFLVTARQRRYDLLFKALVTGGFFSIGKGCFAALAVASSENESELILNTFRYCKAALGVGMAYQQRLPQLTPQLEGSTARGFSMLLINIPLTTLQLIIDQVNTLETSGPSTNVFEAQSLRGGAGGDTNHHQQQQPNPPPPSSGRSSGPSDYSTEAYWNSTPFSEVHISRIISARSAVVVGHPVDLLRLDVLLVRFATKRAMRIHKDILPSTVPENSPFYNQGLQHDVLHNWRTMGVRFHGSELKVPFYSPTHGLELNSSRQLMSEIASAVTCVPQDLTYSLQNLRDGDLLLDFSASSMRIGQMIAWTRRSITCLALPSDRVETSILPSPRRSAQPDVILGTLQKCAVLNELLVGNTGGSSGGNNNNNNNNTSVGFHPSRGSSTTTTDGLGGVGGGGDGAPVVLSPNAKTGPGLFQLTSTTSAAPPRVVQLASSFIDMQLLIDLDGVVLPGGPQPPSSSHHNAHHHHPHPQGDSNANSQTVLRAIRSPDVSITSFPLQPNPNASQGASMRHGSGYFGSGGQLQAMSPTEGLHNGLISPTARSMSAYPSSHGMGGAGGGMMMMDGGGPSAVTTTAWVESKEQLIPTHRLAVVPSTLHRNIINVYQVSPLIKYLEMQHRCVLTSSAVEVAEKLRQLTNFDFPPYTLLMCPTVFALLEFWDGLEFVAELRAERAKHQGLLPPLWGVPGGGGRIGSPLSASGGTGGGLTSSSTPGITTHPSLSALHSPSSLHTANLSSSHNGGGAAPLPPSAQPSSTTTTIPASSYGGIPSAPSLLPNGSSAAAGGGGARAAPSTTSRRVQQHHQALQYIQGGKGLTLPLRHPSFGGGTNSPQSSGMRLRPYDRNTE